MQACMRSSKKRPEGRKKKCLLFWETLNSLRAMHYAARKRQTKVGKGG